MDQDEQGDSRAHEVTSLEVPPSALKYLGADDDVLVRVRLLWTRQMKI
jgi:hypothetical protein